MKNLELDYYLELQRRMEDIFRYVACREENFGAFSIKIESTLIDVCAFLDSVCQDFIRQQQARHELTQKSAREKPSSQDAYTPFRNQVAVDKFDAKVSGVANFNMADYRTLLEPELRLSDCTVRLRAYEENYPSLRNPEGFSLAPFASWKKGQKLQWWESFTKLKHDRISNFQLATLGNSIRNAAGKICSTAYCVDAAVKAPNIAGLGVPSRLST